MWKSYLFSLYKFSYNAWECTVTLLFNNNSIQKWRHCSVFFLFVFFECLEFLFQNILLIVEKFSMSYASFLIMLEKVLSLYFSIKTVNRRHRGHQHSSDHSWNVLCNCCVFKVRWHSLVYENCWGMFCSSWYWRSLWPQDFPRTAICSRERFGKNKIN